MKLQNKEFYIGLSVWVLGVITGFGMWFGDANISIPFEKTTANILLTVFLYLTILVGHLMSHGFLSFLGQSKRVRVAGIILSSLAVLGLTFCLFFAIVALFSTIIVTQLALYIDQRKAYFIALLVPCLGILIDYSLGRTLEYPIVSYPIILIYGTFNVMALIAHFHLISEQKAKDHSEHLLRELTATQSLLKATTERNERIRIARDLHDSLGHQLTALSLQLEVASHVDNNLKQQHLLQAKDISRSILSDVRSTVSDIRQKDDVELVVALRTLTKSIPHLAITLVIDIDESSVSARQVEVIFRCVQEALTNVAKHADASKCSVILSKTLLSNEPEFVVIKIQDNGSKVDDFTPGNGLKGMNERVLELGGELEVSSSEVGFVLTIKLPMLEL